MFDMKQDKKNQIAVFAGGCFWCMEAVFALLPGIHEIVPGYTGGHLSNPRYDQVCTDETGHAEVVKIIFDPTLVSYVDLLKVFFISHNPCTPNQQGADIGSQYRSAIFYVNDEQKKLAQSYVDQLTYNKAFQDPIVTELVQLDVFWPAEDYHRNYFTNHPDQAYCQISIKSKVDKIKKLLETKESGVNQ
jgi:peptide-methionine (S)-S-oxide reductase